MKKRIVLFALAVILIFSTVSVAWASQPTTVAIVTATSLNVRTGPGTSYSVISTISRDTSWFVLSQQAGWVRIVLTNGSTGWVSGNFVALSVVPAQRARVAVSSMYVRSGPGTTFSPIAIAYQGAVMPVLIVRNGWVQIQLPSGQYGWVAGNHVTLSNVPETTVPQQPTQPAPTEPTQPTQPAPAPQPPASQISQFEQAVFDLVNVERQRNGLRPMQIDLKLFEVARIKSKDMHDNRYFSHTSPVYGSPFDMMKRFGITYRYAGENIAAGQATPETVVRAWMNSSGHRANILNPNFTHLGVGYHFGPNNYRHYWTQMFVGR